MEQQGDHIWKPEKQINNPPKNQKNSPTTNNTHTNPILFIIKPKNIY